MLSLSWLSMSAVQDLDRAGMETLQVESCVRGCRFYKRIWNPTVGEELNCMRETTNREDPYTARIHTL